MNNRSALLEAAKNLVAVKGVKATTVAEIAARAGVAKGLLFYYFRDKDSIIQALANEVDALYMAGLPPVSASATAQDSLHALISLISPSLPHLRRVPSSFTRALERLQAAPQRAFTSTCMPASWIF